MGEDAKNLEGIFQEELQKPDVEGETAEDGDSSTPEVSTETPQQDEEKSSEDAALQDLDQDEDFKKTTKEFQKELGSQPTLGQLKAWKKTYWRAKEAEREKESLSKRIAELEACIKSHSIPVKTMAGGVAHYCTGAEHRTNGGGE
jgi:hypothetical protein